MICAPETRQCANCNHTGPLDQHGRCEVCHSDAVISVAILVREVVRREHIDTFFPNPVQHALALLAECRDDLELARSLARTQAMSVSDIEDGKFSYWCDVRDALLPGKAANA